MELLFYQKKMAFYDICCFLSTTFETFETTFEITFVFQQQTTFVVFFLVFFKQYMFISDN